MMKIIRISFLVGLVMCAHDVYSQQQPLSSQYHQNMLTLNPAYSGFAELTKIVTSHRSMLPGLQGSPQTSYVSVEGQGAEEKVKELEKQMNICKIQDTKVANLLSELKALETDPKVKKYLGM
ncbi:MAG: type IX secretion system membrane protein PorP/SprF [Crocinitomicaceae bacterium]|nr:type IX secretion system membrane protein PorP/SprF [Crocinitomicaceae bacterium]